MGNIPPFGRDKDFSVTSFLRNDKIEESITAYQVRGRLIKSGMTEEGAFDKLRMTSAEAQDNSAG